MKFIISLFLIMNLLPAAKEKESNKLGGYNLPDAQLACLKIQKYYNSIKSFKSKFKQVYYKRFYGPQKPETGELFLEKPGKMAWEYKKPEKKFFIVDGKKVWIYEPANKQVLWRKLGESNLPTPVKFLWGKGNLVREYNVKLIPKSKYATPDTRVLKLVPRKKSNHYRSVLFVFDKNGAVKQSIVYDHNGNKNRIYFSKIKLNQKIKSSKFNFKPPKGVQVLHASKAK
ncbi:MAG: outer membrane lipoprotein chaperone LolA [Deltaproteobacteria bacterium]|jgi:outer membrane lipoprotein carrier protein|nr:outer membrane lipoprotein chaperone LolA [Deltaproteobacteria bacterium]